MSKKFSSIKPITVGSLVAYRLAAKQKDGFVTGSMLETWVVREQDGTPVQQVELVRTGTAGQWWAWTGNLIRPQQKVLAEQLAFARQKVTS